MISSVDTEVWNTPAGSTAVVIKIRVESVPVAGDNAGRGKIGDVHNLFDTPPSHMRALAEGRHPVSAPVQSVYADAVAAVGKRVGTQAHRESGLRPAVFEPVFADRKAGPSDPQGLEAGQQVTRNMQVCLEPGNSAQAERDEQAQEEQGRDEDKAALLGDPGRRLSPASGCRGLVPHANHEGGLGRWTMARSWRLMGWLTDRSG